MPDPEIGNVSRKHRGGLTKHEVLSNLELESISANALWGIVVETGSTPDLRTLDRLGRKVINTDNAAYEWQISASLRRHALGEAGLVLAHVVVNTPPKPRYTPLIEHTALIVDRMNLIDQARYKAQDDENAFEPITIGEIGRTATRMLRPAGIRTLDIALPTQRLRILGRHLNSV